MIRFYFLSRTSPHLFALLGYHFRFKMSNEVESKERLEETREYLEEHKILELFNNLTSQMIFARPGMHAVETISTLNKEKVHIYVRCMYFRGTLEFVV